MDILDISNITYNNSEFIQISSGVICLRCDKRNCDRCDRILNL